MRLNPGESNTACHAFTFRLCLTDDMRRFKASTNSKLSRHVSGLHQGVRAAAAFGGAIGKKINDFANKNRLLLNHELRDAFLTDDDEVSPV